MCASLLGARNLEEMVVLRRRRCAWTPKRPSLEIHSQMHPALPPILSALISLRRECWLMLTLSPRLIKVCLSLSVSFCIYILN
jgi:hypothetical protein